MARTLSRNEAEGKTMQAKTVNSAIDDALALRDKWKEARAKGADQRTLTAIYQDFMIASTAVNIAHHAYTHREGAI